jgi:hypothetical protein
MRSDYAFAHLLKSEKFAGWIAMVPPGMLCDKSGKIRSWRTAKAAMRVIDQEFPLKEAGK